MANTYSIISSNVLGSSAATVTFSSIPATYTDLVLRISSKSDSTGDIKANVNIVINGTTTGYSVTNMFATSGTTGANRQTSAANWNRFYTDSSYSVDFTNAFGLLEIYFSNYAGSNNKVASGFGVSESNSSTDYFINATANLWQNSSAISSIALGLNSGQNFVTGSSFYLYGIKNS
jgi:hypothetical protein